MRVNETRDYAVFDDYRYSQRIAVMVRWFLIVVWLVLHNYRPEINSDYLPLNAMVLSLAALNGYVHWRIWRGRPITWPYVFALSATDLTMITIGIGLTSAFRNSFFVLYYPALIGLALVATSWRLSFGIVALVAIAYSALSFAIDNGPDFEIKEEKILLIRLAAMFAIVAAGHLITSIERNRRIEAVKVADAEAEANLASQKKAQQAELAAQRERDRIAREIHDGIAQSIYALGLNLETCAALAEREKGPLRDHLRNLVPIAKQTLLETRHYIHDLRPLLSGESDLKLVAENQVKEYQIVAGTPIKLSVTGEPSQVSVSVAGALYRILQEALANILKHAQASSVQVALSFEPNRVMLSVQDDGRGIQTNGRSLGYGIQNMRERADELDGTFEISGAPGKGTRVDVTLPI